MRVKIINSTAAFLRGTTRLVATLAAALSFSATAAITPPAPPVNLFVPIDLDDIFIPLVIPFAIDPDAPWYQADFNGDGYLDLLVQAKDGSGTNYIFYGNAQGKYTSIGQQWKNGHLGLEWSADKSNIYIADFNNDGRADIILESNANGGAVALLLTGTGGAINTVSQTWTEPTVPTPSTFTPTTTTVGATAGSFAVSPSGASTYTIPVSVPPGIGGMQPGIALSYSSHGGNGIAGLGWSIAGLSVVHRCEATLDRDGFEGGINLDSNDRFCLDGQRLVTVDARTTSECALEFRTEMESFQRILGCGTAGSGPQYFKVYARNGAVSYYGNTADSSVGSTAKPDILTWAINRTEDANGNYMTFSYLKADGTHTIDHIDYTGTKTTAPNRRVVFEYVAPTDADHRVDIETSYMAGSISRISKRLKTIKTLLGPAEIHKYELSYTYEATGVGANLRAPRSLLKSINECAIDAKIDATTWHCFAKPIEFEWVGATTDWVTTNPIPPGYVSQTTGYCFNGDLDGDGKTDNWCYAGKDASGNGLWNVGISTGTNWSVPPKWIGPAVGYSEFNTAGYVTYILPGESCFTGDHNGDGRTDMWCYTGSSSSIGSWRLALSKGDHWETQNIDSPITTATWTTRTPIAQQCFTGDLNGDSKADMWCYTGGDKWQAALSTGAGWVTSSGYPLWGFSATFPLNNACFTGDLNGDGKHDMTCYTGQNGDWDVVLSTSRGWSELDMQISWTSNQVWRGPSPTTPTPTTPITHQCLTGDMNGDGKTDVWCKAPNSSYTWHVALSTGTNWDAGSQSTGLGGWPTELGVQLPDACRTGDVNGDGKTDMFCHPQIGGAWHVAISSGSGWGLTSPSDALIWSGPYLHAAGIDSSCDMGDLNGDGKTEVWCHVLNKYYVATSSSYGATVITGITNGFNAKTSIVYKPLTDSEVYTRENNGDVSKGTSDIEAPTLVVAEAASSNGVSVAYTQEYLGTSTTSATKYHYTGKLEHQLGRGDLGFRVITTTAPNGVTTTTYNRQDFPFAGSPYRTEVAKSAVDQSLGKFLSVSLTSFDKQELGTTSNASLLGNKRFVTYSTSTTSYNYELDGIEISHITTTSDPPDADGNTTKVKVESSDGFVKITQSTFATSDYLNWRFGNAVLTSITSTTPGAFSVTGQPLTETRTSGFVFDAAGQLRLEVVEPTSALTPGTVYYSGMEQSSALYGTRTVITRHDYDSMGLPTENTVFALDYVIGPALDASGKVQLDANKKPIERIISGSGNIVSRRTSKSSYVENGDGTATVTSWNAKDHKETQTVDLRIGAPTSSTGPNGLTTKWYYDAFGRKVAEVRADGTSSATAYKSCASAACPSHVAAASFYIESTSSTTTAVAKTYHDILGRAITTETQGLNGETIYKDAFYDDYGRVWKSTNAYFANNPTGKTEASTQYNAILGRIESATVPDESQPDSSATVKTSTSYGVNSYFDSASGSTVKIAQVVITDSNNHVRSESHNSEGKLASTTDSNGSTLDYKYDAFGNLISVIKTGYDTKNAWTTIVTTTGYDARGRKVYMQDPDMGQWLYAYNAFGELKWQQDAKGQTVTMNYDVLGRMLSRTENEGTSSWVYDTAPHGIGKLAKETGAPGSFTYAPARAYIYDDLGRPSLVGISLNGEAFTMYSGYDASGRVVSSTYPGVNGERFTVKRVFNSLGYMTDVTDASGANTYWHVNTMDANGRVTKETLGNGATNEYQYTKGGRVRDINSTGAGLNIQRFTYTYDKVANLASRDDGTVKETLAYDAIDRLVGVTATGNATFNRSYSYDAFGNFKIKSDVDADEWVYGLKPGVLSTYAGPHAVTQLKKAGVVVDEYRYDANGNQTSGGGRTIDYTSFNMPKRIATATSVVEFAYDGAHERITQVKDGEQTLYLSPRWDTGIQFLKTSKKDGSTEYQHHIYAASTPVAVYTATVTGTTVAKKTRYFHKDHLGSITAITDETGNTVERFSFDPFGARRQSGAFNNLTSTETRHGYTGHEMLDSVNLVHMNGRIYDPKLGRFLQADPTIQAPNNLQSFNRYSYVMNNPLSMTDPSGYSWLSKKWKKAWKHGLKQVVSIAAAAIVTSVTGCSACGGFVAGYISTGTLKGAMMGAASSLAFSFAGDIGQGMGTGPMASIGRMALHGTVGGVMSVAQGGSFKSGFVSGAFAKGASEMGVTNFARDSGMSGVLARTAVAAVVGGVGSMAVGGNFRDGAMTGAFSHLFNDEMNHEGRGVIGRAWDKVTGTMNDWGVRLGLSASANGFSAGVTTEGWSAKSPTGSYGDTWSGESGDPDAHRVNVYDESVKKGPVTFKGGVDVDLGTATYKAAATGFNALSGIPTAQNLMKQDADGMARMRDAGVELK